MDASGIGLADLNRAWNAASDPQAMRDACAAGGTAILPLKRPGPGKACTASRCAHRVNFKQLALLVQLLHDVEAAHELAVAIQLRVRRPVGELLQTLAHLFIAQNVF